MTLPSNPPASTQPTALKTWAQAVTDTAADHETRIATVEADPGGGGGPTYMTDSEDLPWASVPGVLVAGDLADRGLDLTAGDASAGVAPFSVVSAVAYGYGEADLDMYADDGTDNADFYVTVTPGTSTRAKVAYNNHSVNATATASTVAVEFSRLPFTATNIRVNADGMGINTAGIPMGFNGATPVAKPEITGSIASNLPAIVTALLAALESLGLITDSTTA